MAQRGYGKPERVTYGRIQGSAASVIAEFDAIVDELRKVAVGRDFLEKNNPDTMESGHVFHCKLVKNLEKYLERNEKIDLVSRIKSLRRSIGIAVKRTLKAEKFQRFDDFFTMLEEMQAGVEVEGFSGKVLPDMEVIKAGLHTCNRRVDFIKLYKLMNNLEIKPDIVFFNKWLMCSVTASEVCWVCDKAVEAGYPNLNRDSRNVLWALMGSGRVQVKRILPMRELVSFKLYLERKVETVGADGRFWRDLFAKAEVLSVGYSGDGGVGRRLLKGQMDGDPRHCSEMVLPRGGRKAGSHDSNDGRVTRRRRKMVSARGLPPDLDEQT
jgi:hypothetical protein